MAVSNLAAINNALSQLFDPSITRQWNRSCELFKRLPTKAGTGKNVAWSVSTSGQTAAVHTEGADVEATELLIDAKVPMYLSYCLYRNGFGMSELQLEAAAQSKGSAQEIINLLKESVFESSAALALKLNQDLYTGNPSSNEICGLDYSLLVSGSYAGQNVGSVTSLRSNLDTNSGVNRALTLELMNKMESTIFTRCGMKPNLIVTSPGVWNKYASLLDPVRRVNGIEGDIGADEFYFRGIPVVRDFSCGAGKMYFLNTNQIEIEYMPMVNFGDSVSFQIQLAAGSNGMDMQTTSVPVKWQSLSKTGDSVKYFGRTALQLKVKRPNSCGIISYITE